MGEIIVDKPTSADYRQFDARARSVSCGSIQITASSRTPKVREADYTKPATLAAAIAGADSVLLISSPGLGVRVAEHTAVDRCGQGCRRVLHTGAGDGADVAAGQRQRSGRCHTAQADTGKTRHATRRSCPLSPKCKLATWLWMCCQAAADRFVFRFGLAKLTSIGFSFGPPASSYAAAPDSDIKTERGQEVSHLMDATSKGGNWMLCNYGDLVQLVPGPSLPGKFNLCKVIYPRGSPCTAVPARVFRQCSPLIDCTGIRRQRFSSKSTQDGGAAISR